MDNNSYQAYMSIINILHSLTKMDIRLIDQSGAALAQIINHTIPVVLHQPDDEHTHIHEVLGQNEPGQYYDYTNSYGLSYMAAGIWRNQTLYGSIVIGPFITSLSVIDLVKDIIVNNNLPIGERNQLEHYYESLPIISDVEHDHIGELLGHLCMNNQIRSERITADTRRLPPNTNVQKAILEENKEVIERRYEYQNKLMDAITRGDIKKITDQMNQLTSELVAFSDRVPGSPIRSSKNIGIVLNTMCRIAAERSGVHPVYLHNISERFAIQIEKTYTIPYLKTLFLTMAIEYCDLVTTVATGQYSPIVKKAIDYMLLNLGGPLPLQQIAEHIHINPSHLSRKFKEDTGMTITDFINRKRVDEAALYLRRGNISITEVAFLVGFNDLNYFSKVFKNLMSETPSQYARKSSL
jgi:two-component system, response regulator YesN